MATIIKHKRSSVPGKKPTAGQLESGELAINTADGKIFLLKDDNTVSDLTQGIFQNDTSVTVVDENDSSQGVVSIIVDNDEKVNVTNASINLKDSVVIENENSLTFKENAGGGLAGVSLKAPTNLVDSYTLTLPSTLGTAGTVLGVNSNGELYFGGADVYGGNTVFVSAENGSDLNDGIDLPVKTIKRACQIAAGLVYNPDGTTNGKRVNIKVAVGEYVENNPVIVPDNVIIKGDGLRGCILRPQNANQDMLRVRNGSYFAEFTFRDAVDTNFVPLFTFDYAVAFDDPSDASTSRAGYTYLPTTKPTIVTSPYIQNCSIISFLGGNGAKIDGSKVNSPNVPQLQLEVENPVVGPAPEQGKSMVANAFTMLSFGGTGWRLVNDAYAQIVSCFQIFLLNGVYTQSGGYCSITNSATNFGLYALRSSGYSPKTFKFDRGFVVSTGVSSGAQALTVIGVNRVAPVEEFVVRFRQPEYKIAYNLIYSEKENLVDDTINWINLQITSATPGSLWDGFVYNEETYRAAFRVILDAVADDTWSTGNSITRQVTLSYFSNRLADSSSLTISEQEDQFGAAIEQLSVYTGTTLASLDSTVKSFVDEKFNLIKNGISEPSTIPEAVDVTSEGDISNDYKTSPIEVSFNAATAINSTLNIITIPSHGLTNGQAVVYNNNGNPSIPGLDAEQTYFVKLINTDEFTLTFDDSLQFNVDIRSAGTGTHKFLSDIVEFYVNEVLSSHTVYQTLVLQSGSETATFIPGRAISGTTGASNNNAYVYSWSPNTRELVVSIEEVTVGASTQRVQFDASSVIANDHSVVPVTNIGVNEVSIKTGLSTSTFTVGSTKNGALLTNLINLPEKQVWFHRPSVVNSSSHTWEYAGSGTDYNALPQNGGNTREIYEQYQELPGRVYTSGTNELGDFKVGNFITAFNRTGNITFRNKVTVEELDVLRLAFSDIVIEEISTDVNLGDNELGGPKDSRLSTQLAIRSFLSNRLGGFIDKTVSTAAVPGAIVQLNTNGQLNAELIPATRQFTSTTTEGYLSKLLQVDEIPAVDLKAGDIATEEYEQIELTLSGNITASDGDTITQPSTGATGYVKGDYSNSPTIIVASIGAEFKAGDDSTGTDFDTAGTIFVNNVSSGVYPTLLGTSSAITENFFLKSSNTSQYLVLSNGGSYTYTSTTITNVSRNINVATITTADTHNLQTGSHVQIVCTSDSTFTVNGEVISAPTSNTFTIANTGTNVSSTAGTGTVRTIVSSADGNAQGAVTETRYGVLTNVDNANITGGAGYTPGAGSVTYEFVPLVASTGVGTGAYADITVTAGQVTDVDLRRGGTGYEIGDLLTVSSGNIGGTGAGFQIEVSAIEKRAYVNILGGELFVASTSSVDFVEDNTAPSTKETVTLTSTVSNNFLAGDSGAGGNVNYTTHRISITTHGLSNGDPVKYDTLGNVAIGGLINGEVYYAKYIDANTIELYEDFSLLNKIEFTSTPANNSHNLTRFTVNVIDNSIVVPGHGWTTGAAIRVEGASLFSIAGEQVVSGSRFFIGSVTTNSFTLHELRSEALASINGLVTGAKNIDAVGTGTADFYLQNVQVNSVVNTSSRVKSNWNSLTASNIDASNIVSGVITPSRLASSGTANTDTFLRGDSSYQTVVQSIKKANTTDNPITLTGSNVAGEYYGDPVNIGIANVDLDIGQSYSTLGVARFLQSQFDVDVNGTGQVFIKSGVVDAGTLDGLDSAYFLNPANLTSAVPVNKGGTNLTNYATGDMIYAQSPGTLGTLTIGRANSFLRSTGTIPEWSTALELAEGLDVKSARLSSTSTGIGTVYNDNVTSLELGSNAETVKIGRSTATRDITSFVSGYDASISTTVAVNLATFTKTTNSSTANAINEIQMTNTTGILFGMLVTGSASIPANTTVTGVTSEYVYLSNDTVGTIPSSTTLTFTYTPLTLGIRSGDTINISGSGITNLDGSWPVQAATANGNSFTITTASNVTANPANPVSGTITKDNTILFRNRNVIFGSAETSSSPVAATLKGENATGINISGGSFVVQAGLGTGNSTGGTLVFKTGQVTSPGTSIQPSTTRLTIDTSGISTFTGEVRTAGIIRSTEATANVFNTVSTTINAFGAATTLSIGAATGDTTVNNNLTVAGNLTVNGTTTTVNSTTISVDDKNIELGSVGSPSDTTADGGGITLRGSTDKTIIWDDLNDNWTSSEHWNLATGKKFKINNVDVLTNTTLGSTVVNSSLTSVGTIGTGTWQGTVIAGTYGGTGVNNGTKTITLGGNLVTAGAFQLTLTATNTTNVTLPTSGTLAIVGDPLSQFASTTSAQLAGVISDETGSGKLVFATSPTFTTSLLTDSATLSVFNTNATTINAFGAASVIAMGAATSMVTFGDDITVTGLTKATQGVQFGATDSYLYESASNIATLRIGADGPFISFTDSGSNTATVSNASGPLTITTGAGNGDITFTPHGTGDVIVSSGNLGVGISAPNAKLHTYQTIGSQKSSSVILGAAYTVGDLSHGLSFSINNNDPSAGIYVADGGAGSASLIFTTSPSFTTPTNAEAMRITSAGSVAIGRTTADTKLDVLGSITARTALTQDGVILAGRAGGTGNFAVTIQPTTLTANRTVTLADGNTILQAGTMAVTGGTLAQFAATTSAQLAGVISDETGSGALVFATSPSLTTPSLGVATATSINRVAITAPATGSTLTIADGKTLSVSNTLTFTGTDSSSVAFGTGGTVAYTANNLGAFAATTSAQLAGVISDETGSGALVFANTPTLVTPVIGAATGTSLTLTGGSLTARPAANQDGVVIAGRAGGTENYAVTIQPTTLTASRTVTLADGNTTLQAGTMAITGGTLAQFAATTSAQLAGVISDETGSGALVFANTPTLVTPVIGAATGTSLTLTGGSLTARPAATQDGVILAGRAGGTGNFAVTISPTTLTASRTVTLADGNTTLQAGTMAITGGTLAQFAATTSAQLAGVISDETGSGALVFGTSPTFTTSIDSGATFGAFASSTALTLGYTGTAASTTNISTGAVASGSTKTINIGTGGAAGSTTAINIGTGPASGSTVINSRTVVMPGYATMGSTALAITGPIITLGTLASGGSGYMNGTHVNQALTGGTGAGMLGTVVVSAGVVTSITLTWGGHRYSIGDTLTVPSLTTTLSTIAASGTGTTATLTFAAQAVAPFEIGSQIVVAGVTPTGYNGTYTVTGCTTTTVSYANTTTGAQTVAGTVKMGTALTNATIPVSVARASNLYVSSAVTSTVGSRIRLEFDSTTVATGNEYGAIVFSSRSSSTQGSGDVGFIRGVALGSAGGSEIELWTAAAGEAPNISATITSAGNFRMYNATGTFYSELSNAPTANRTVTIPDVSGTMAIIQSAATAGYFDTSATTPTATNRLNYGGNFYPTALNIVGTADTATAATHYFVETGTDGFVRPKTLANVRTEIVTTAAVNSAAATTVGTVTSGIWNAGAVTSTGDFITTAAWDAADGGAQLYLNGTTGNRIEFNVNGTGAPAFTTRSVGTKIVLLSGISASAVDYGFGIETNTLWSSVPTTSQQFRWYGGTTVAATLTGAGAFTATNEVTAYSDSRLKENVTLIADPLTKVLSIRGVNFTRNDLEDKERVYMGVIAQEVEQYIPEVVTTTEDGIKTVNYGAMAGLFIEAIKAQQKQIDELTALVQKLIEK